MRLSLDKIAAIRRPVRLSPVIANSGLGKGDHLPDFVGACAPAFFDNQTPAFSAGASRHSTGRESTVVDLHRRAEGRDRKEVGIEVDGTFHIRCTRLDGPSRYERRSANKSSLHPQILSDGRRHLGTFDGERKRLTSAAADPSATLGRDLASLLWLCAFLTVVAFVVGAL